MDRLLIVGVDGYPIEYTDTRGASSTTAAADKYYTASNTDAVVSTRRDGTE